MQLVGAELLYRRGTPPDAEYTFKHALVQDAAYSTLLRSRRQQLHGRIVSVLEEQFPETVASEPERLAQHCSEAGRLGEAIAYWHRAGQRAVQRSANQEAVGHLTKAIDFLRGLPDTAERAAKELPLQRLLGTALMATRGFAAPETGASFSRARELALTVADNQDVYPMLMGVWAFEINQGNHARAREVGGDILTRVEADDDPEPSILGHHAAGCFDYHTGGLASARWHFAQALGIYETRPPATSFAHRYGLEFGATAYAFASWLHWLLGYPDQALWFGDHAQAVSRRVKHAFTASRALYWSALLHQFRREWSIVEQDADRLIISAEDQGYPVNRAIGHILRGAARAALGDGELGIRELREGLDAYSATGTRLQRPHYLTVLAEALRSHARIAEGLATLDEATDLIEATGERYVEAEIHRLRGALQLASANVGSIEAEFSYRRALDISRTQQARSLELRASTSLARLWRDQGKRTEARDLLAPIYCWFTEGFDTPDLKEARALLDELTS